MMLLIRRMKKEDFSRVKALFKEGLPKQKPKGSMSDAGITKILKAATTYTCIKGNNVIGFVSFTESKKRIYLVFIYAAKPREGIGRALMLKVAKYALEHNITSIKSSMSIIDKAASAFYKAMGFSKRKKMNWFLYAISASPRAVVLRAGNADHAQGSRMKILRGL